MAGRVTGPGAPSLQHSPSTSDADPPPPGALVHLLLGHALVDEARGPYGWGHPPDHLRPEQIRWEPAPEATGPLL